jgi:hypothetical protein
MMGGRRDRIEKSPVHRAGISKRQLSCGFPPDLFVCYTHGCWGIGETLPNITGGSDARPISARAHLVRSAAAL